MAAGHVSENAFYQVVAKTATGILNYDNVVMFKFLPSIVVFFVWLCMSKFSNFIRNCDEIQISSFLQGALGKRYNNFFFKYFLTH